MNSSLDNINKCTSVKMYIFAHSAQKLPTFFDLLQITIWELTSNSHV